MTILSHGAGKAHSQVCQRFHRLANLCAVIGLGPVNSKSLWTTPVLLASWSRKIFPLVASSNIESHITTIMDFIWNCISAFYHRFSHSFGNIRNNLLKQAAQKIIQLAVNSKVTSKNLSQELSLGIARYIPGHLTQLNDYSQVYIMEHLTFIQRLVTEISFRNNLRVSFLIT